MSSITVSIQPSRMATEASVIHTRFGKDTTLRLSCRAGDYMLWCNPKGLLSDEYLVKDIWQLKDGDYVTLTNRHADLPGWFTLHPLETSGRLAYSLYGETLPASQATDDIVDGPNIWRISIGDRLAWVGKKRAGVDCDGGVLSIISFTANAFIVGEPISTSDGFPVFGEIDQLEQTEEEKDLCLAGIHAISRLGSPRSLPDMNSTWSIGD